MLESPFHLYQGDTRILCDIRWFGFFLSRSEKLQIIYISKVNSGGNLKLCLHFKRYEKYSNAAFISVLTQMPLDNILIPCFPLFSFSPFFPGC